jgi:hypothetical protein
MKQMPLAIRRCAQGKVIIDRFIQMSGNNMIMIMVYESALKIVLHNLIEMLNENDIRHLCPPIDSLQFFVLPPYSSVLVMGTPCAPHPISSPLKRRECC